MLQQLKTNPVLLRIFTIGGIILFLLIPLGLIHGLIGEREQRSEEARLEIGKKWGSRQDVQGPFLVIKYKTKTDPTAFGEMYVLPEELGIKGDIKSEVRRRGIFETVLYNSELEFRGKFRIPSSNELRAHLPQASTVYTESANLVVIFPDTRGLRKSGPLTWNGDKISFTPGSGNLERKGIHARVKTDDSNSVSFQFSLQLLGNERLSFVPAGKFTKVELASNWPNPSFTGYYLPDERDVHSEGFHASWEVSSLGRSYGQILVDPYDSVPVLLEESAFGVTLINPLNHYHKTERAVKYALLFLALTFTGFFLFEIFNRYRIHPVQYGLVGLSMILFYALFLSLTEQVAFLPAYLISSAATVGLITFYSRYVLRNTLRAYAMGGFLSSLYFYLYVVLRSEDYALILGTFGLFAILGLVMFITRNLDWYAIRMSNESTP